MSTLEAFLQQYHVDSVLEAAVSLATTLLEVLGILLLCYVLIRITRKASEKFFKMQSNSKRLHMTERKADTLHSITSSILKYGIYFIGLFSVLTHLGVDSKSLIVIASAGSVAVGLGAQNVVTDMLEGFFILFEDHYAVGDIVTIQSITGVVESVSLRSTKVRDLYGRVHIIPNGSVGTVTNLCDEFINAVVEVGVTYNGKIDATLDILRDEMKLAHDIPGVIDLPNVVGVIGLDDSCVTIRIVTKCNIKTNIAVETELRRRIKNRLDQEGIEIPFPQRTLHIIQEKEA